MFDYDVVIIGGGPAGLTAGIYLARAKRRTLVLEKGSPGGYLQNIELIENYPGFAGGISGAGLAAEMTEQAARFSANFGTGEVTAIELYSNCKYVACSGGTGYSASVVIVAGGSRHRKLGVPGEKELENKGVFNCGLCDGSRFTDRVVAVCGGGDSGITEALYMTKLASRVVLLEALPKLTASAILRERVEANPSVEIHTGVRVEAITGKDRVEGIEISDNGKKSVIAVDGVLVQIGIDPNTDYLKGTLSLNEQGQIIVNEKLESSVPCILAAGDIRSGSCRQVVTAVGDGAAAAITAERLLQNME